MKIAVIVRQVPDLIEPIEISSSRTEVDLDGATFIMNESDDHALEQALLIKECVTGTTVHVVSLDFGDIDGTLFTAAAKGVDDLLKIPREEESQLGPRQAAGLYAQVIRELEPELIMVGGYSHDELEGSLAPFLAGTLQLPYVGVVRGVQVQDGAGAITVFKEFPGAAMARLTVTLPAVLGIVGADSPPRYVPVSRIRAAMKSAEVREPKVDILPADPHVSVVACRLPEATGRAEMLSGSDESVSASVVAVLREKGVIK